MNPKTCNCAFFLGCPHRDNADPKDGGVIDHMLAEKAKESILDGMTPEEIREFYKELSEHPVVKDKELGWLAGAIPGDVFLLGHARIPYIFQGKFIFCGPLGVSIIHPHKFSVVEVLHRMPRH